MAALEDAVAAVGRRDRRIHRFAAGRPLLDAAGRVRGKLSTLTAQLASLLGAAMLVLLGPVREVSAAILTV